MEKYELGNIELPTSTLGYLKLKFILIKDMLINSKDYSTKEEKENQYLKEKIKEYINKKI